MVASILKSLLLEILFVTTLSVFQSQVTYVTEFTKRGLIHFSDFPTLRKHTFIFKQAIKLKFSQCYNYNDRRVLLPNFKAVGPTQAELHPLKVAKSGACIRPPFANSVTYS